jgi:hypothetical protein
MTINIELSEERIETLSNKGFITDKKPDTIVVNEDKAKLAAKNVKATEAPSNGSAKSGEGNSTGETKDGDTSGSGETGDDLESAREKLEKGKRLTIPEIKAVLDDEFIEYNDDMNHGELMKLVPVK